jgi:hypothetical protein
MMRRASLIAALLIVSLANTASACVIGPSVSPAASCRRAKSGKPCAQKIVQSTNSPCDHVVKSVPAQCSLRGLLQFQLLQFRAFDISVPLLKTAENLSLPPDSTFRFTSIGSPETDRGPPHS